MTGDELPLNRLSVGRAARVTRLTSGGATRRRLLDLGIVEGTVIEPLFASPSGSPVAYRVRGTVIALRADASRGILVSAAAPEREEEALPWTSQNTRPGPPNAPAR